MKTLEKTTKTKIKSITLSGDLKATIEIEMDLKTPTPIDIRDEYGDTAIRGFKGHILLPEGTYWRIYNTKTKTTSETINQETTEMLLWIVATLAEQTTGLLPETITREDIAQIAYHYTAKRPEWEIKIRQIDSHAHFKLACNGYECHPDDNSRCIMRLKDFANLIHTLQPKATKSQDYKWTAPYGEGEKTVQRWLAKNGIDLTAYY